MADQIKRTIHYYSLNFNYLKEARDNGRTHEEVVNKIKKLCDKKRSNRFIKRYPKDENKFGIFEYKTFGKKEPNCIAFKFIRMRKDIFPQLLDDQETKLEDIVDAENKSIVESTHVFVNFSDPITITIGIEYNYEGPKINDLLIYFKRIGKNLDLFRNIYAHIVTNDKLEELANKIGKCRSIFVKVLPENIATAQSHDKKLGDALAHNASITPSRYLTVNLHLDYKEHSRENKSYVMGLINKLTKNREDLEYYEMFQVEAEDTSKDLKQFEVFDLLVDKVKSNINVDRKAKSKVVVSGKMYKLMLEEYHNKID